MGHPQIRIYETADTQPTTPDHGAEPQVQVTLGEICHLIADAVNHRRAWLEDFQDEPVTLTSDLHDLLMAYEHFRAS